MGLRKRYLVERDIPGVGGMSIVELCGAARASNNAIARMNHAVQWQHSYVSGDEIFCIYFAESEEALRQHAELAGISVRRIVEISQIIDPMTANN
jgi:Protein of unknown function (DUF4242)